MKKIFRKRAHIKHVSETIADLHIDIINSAVKAQHALPIEVQNSIIAKASLIRKYERRLKLLNF